MEDKQETKLEIIDLENWMSNLPPRLRVLPLVYLAIPGTHDSMTYHINRKSRVAPDAEEFLQRLKFLGPILRLIMAKWAKTQAFDVKSQLKAGIRYFDLRVATKKGTDKLFFVHGLYSCLIDELLSNIREFIDTHTGELVILDWQHFYAFGPSDHENMMNTIAEVFGDKLVPYTHHMEQLSLDTCTNNDMQLIAIYRSDAARFGRPLLWPSLSFPAPWPNTVSISDLFQKLDKGLKCRPADTGYISQCVLTPSSWFVCKHLFSSLEKRCAIPLAKQKYKWIRKQSLGPCGVNIIIADFVNLVDSQFCQEVVSLNYKILKSAENSESIIT